MLRFNGLTTSSRNNLNLPIKKRDRSTTTSSRFRNTTTFALRKEVCKMGVLSALEKNAAQIGDVRRHFPYLRNPWNTTTCRRCTSVKFSHVRDFQQPTQTNVA